MWYKRFTAIVFLLIYAMLFLICIKCKAQDFPFIKVKHDSFVSYYDTQTHNPALVVYQLEYSHFSGHAKVGNRHFKIDTQLPRPRVKDSDYTSTGYVRGHLCSAGDRDSDKAWLKETYYTSNLVPMTMVCNSGAWKVIEDSCRLLATRGHRLLIARGPLYDYTVNVLQDVSHEQLARSGHNPFIEVPDGFFCAVKCLDCGYRGFMVCCNTLSKRSGTILDGNVIQVPRYQQDFRIAVLLQNIIGTWSREVYETTTR